MKGKIIVIEGTDCSGKETQTRLLLQALKKDGVKAEVMSFPTYDTPAGKIVGGPYLGRESLCESYFTEGALNVDPKVASLYYAADRRYNLSKIKKYLEDGYIVIMDRYVESNMAHQGSRIENKEERLAFYKWLEKLEYELLELPKPDLTILLHMPYQKVLELKRGRNTSDEYENSFLHLKNTEATYLELASLHNYNVIECTEKDKLKDIFAIHEEIKNIIKEME